MFQFSVPYRFNWRSRVVEIDRYGTLIFILLNVTGCVTQNSVWYKNVLNFWYFICNHWWKTSKSIWSVYYSLKFYISTRVSYFLPFPGNGAKYMHNCLIFYRCSSLCIAKCLGHLVRRSIFGFLRYPYPFKDQSIWNRKKITFWLPRKPWFSVISIIKNI